MVENKLLEQYQSQLDDSLQLFQDNRVGDLIEQVALYTVRYYQTLIDKGVPPEHAATITAAYSSQIAALKP